ncbi:hypothetical protein BC940DRAFT_349966 [Gongronella butleri]|nr:hypothetical protein BC940DRAFT_349966 [Gongronella butleri]
METYSLSRQCADDGTCYCDWRLTITGCEGSRGFHIIYYTMIGFSAFVTLLTFGVFIHRRSVKGQQLFDLSTKSILKPRPIDCLMLFLSIFNLLRMLTAIILVTDVTPDNVLGRSFLFEFPWQFGYGGCALYLLGIAQTLADSHKASARQWLPSTRTVDVFGLTFFIAPFIVNNVCSIAAGVLSSTNVYASVIFTRVLYVLWFVHCGSLSLAVLLTGIRLHRVLANHLMKFYNKGSSKQYASIRVGMIKIKLIVGIMFLALAGFAAFLLLYGILRSLIIQSIPGSFVLASVWNFLGPAASFLATFPVIFNPRIDDKPTLGLPENSSYNNSSSLQHGSSSARGTLSAVAFETLQKLKMEPIDKFKIDEEDIFMERSIHERSVTHETSKSTLIGGTENRYHRF